MIFDILNIFLLVGAVQGLIFSFSAFFSPTLKSVSSFFPGLLILSFTLYLTQNYLLLNEIVSEEIYYNFIFIPFASLFAPLFYNFVKLILFPKNKISKINYLFFLPFMVFFGVSVLLKISFITGIFHHIETNLFKNFIVFQKAFSIVYSLYIFGSVYKLISDYENRSNKRNQTELSLYIKWLKALNFVLMALFICWIWPLFLEIGNAPGSKISYYFLWTGMAIVIYVLGHVGLYRYRLVRMQRNIQTLSVGQLQGVNNIYIAENVGCIPAFERLIRENKKYLDSNLSLETVAGELGLNSCYLSTVINSELKMSFSDYINRLRVEQVKKLMLDPEFKGYSILSLGLEAGFNSKTPFNRAFKKFTGMTPSQFKKKNLKSLYDS